MRLMLKPVQRAHKKPVESGKTLLGCFDPASIGTLWAVWTSSVVWDHNTDSCAVQIAWGLMAVLISGGLKSKIHSFRLLQKGQCVLHPDPSNHTWHEKKENPQPSPITTTREGQSSCDCSKLDLYKLECSIPAGYSVQEGYLGKTFKANQGQDFNSEQHKTSRAFPFPLY